MRQRLRLMPLLLATCVADAIAPLIPPKDSNAQGERAERPASWRPGISVVIPERDAPQLLAEALDSVTIALARIDETHEIVVVVNGSDPASYAALRDQHANVRFVFHAAPLSFARAIDAGLGVTSHDWALLLNNDMRLDPGAVVELARHRAEDVFAIGAQIYQRNSEGRREETGFTDWYVDGNGVHLFHAPVPDTSHAVEHLCASGGAALFRTFPLRHYVRASIVYDPFYWEDAEWSVRAWRDGLRVLLAPDAHAEHRHRATTARFYAAAELERIVERNRLLFDARHHVTREPPSTLMQRVCDLPYRSQRELASPSMATAVLDQRIRAQRSPQPLPPPVLWRRDADSVRLADASYSYRLGERSTRPRLLLVTPFAIFPPRHGGARRITELLRELRTLYDVILVSDEAQLYDPRSFAFFDGLAAVYLVQRRERTQRDLPREMDLRMRAHAHRALVQTVQRAIAEHDPALVQIEHAELASLIELRSPRERWILGLHDAVRAEDLSSADAFTHFERDVVARFDAVTVCSDEDAALVHHETVVRVPNGSTVRLDGYRPSQGRRLLFVGPFRYAPNALGITQFLKRTYPAIRARVPEVELLVLGGDEALPATRDDALFHQPGVAVYGHRDDVPRLLADCTMTINPQTGIRGSAVKLVESLSAGRVCVTTAEGARGFHGQSFASLATVPDVAAMSTPIIDLLLDEPARHRREIPDTTRLEPYQWSSCARIQHALYDKLLARGDAA